MDAEKLKELYERSDKIIIGTADKIKAQRKKTIKMLLAITITTVILTFLVRTGEAAIFLLCGFSISITAIFLYDKYLCDKIIKLSNTSPEVGKLADEYAEFIEKEFGYTPGDSVSDEDKKKMSEAINKIMEDYRDRAREVFKKYANEK